MQTATCDNLAANTNGPSGAIPAADRAVDAWLQLHPRAAVSAITRLTGEDDRDVYRLESADDAGEAVVAKCCGAVSAAAERLAYDRVLPWIGLSPLLRCYGVAPDASAGRCWLFVQDAGTGPYDMESAAHRELAGRWLGRFHAAGMRAGPDPALRQRGARWLATLLRECDEVLDKACRYTFLGQPDRVALDSVRSCCRRVAGRLGEIESLCDGTPCTVTHGDFAGRNIRRRETPDGTTLVVFDWPDIAWGPPAIDLVISTHETATDTASPDLAAYCNAVASAWPGVTLAKVERLAWLGELFWHVFAVKMDAGGISPGYTDRPLAHMADYCAGISNALDALGWTP